MQAGTLVVRQGAPAKGALHRQAGRVPRDVPLGRPRGRGRSPPAARALRRPRRGTRAASGRVGHGRDRVGALCLARRISPRSARAARSSPRPWTRSGSSGPRDAWPRFAPPAADGIVATARIPALHVSRRRAPGRPGPPQGRLPRAPRGDAPDRRRPHVRLAPRRPLGNRVDGRAGQREHRHRRAVLQEARLQGIQRLPRRPERGVPAPLGRGPAGGPRGADGPVLGPHGGGAPRPGQPEPPAPDARPRDARVRDPAPDAAPGTGSSSDAGSPT